ncbi:MAG: tRNA pseudouridine(38-40) synthase TruA [Thermoanaerobaculia bacterium]|nr:tRNA pseudouridine(38-40) synthase TruA [Thermoanaerobaculia bacterium]
MPTYRLTIEYEGTRYRGWQEQKNARTVAGEVRQAIEGAAGEKVELGGSGRTDAGVHALAQVAHLKTAGKLRREEVLRAVNDALPADIHLLSLEPAGERFHARHTATSRSYVYQISRRRTALAKRFVWWVRRPLDVGAMRAGAQLLSGRHDFARFCEKPLEQTSTVVVVERCEVESIGELVLVRVVASHFLWKMVRRIVGALVEVGGGTLSLAALEGLLDPQGPAKAGEFLPAETTAPPSGLFLERVLYPGDAPLGAVRPVTPIER